MERNSAIVIYNGSGIYKAGQSGEYTPRTVIQVIVGIAKTSLIVMGTLNIYV